LIVVEGGEAAEVFGGLAEEGGEGAGEGVVAFFGEADAACPERRFVYCRRVAFGEGFYFDAKFLFVLIRIIRCNCFLVPDGAFVFEAGRAEIEQDGKFVAGRDQACPEQIEG